MFCENKTIKNNSKIYVDYDYFKENHKETIAECYYKCSELWKDKIKAKIEEILNSENSEAIEKLIEWQSLLEKE